VVGWFQIAGIEYDTPEGIWKSLNGSSGLSEREFQEYFDGTNSAVAILIGQYHRLEVPADLKRIPRVKRPPQSFQYLDENDVDWLLGDSEFRYRQRLLANV
jgi:predicted transcriptional regulator